MKALRVYQKLADKELSGADLAKRALAKEELVPILVDGMGQKKAETKYGCAKALRIIADERPELLYPHFETFAGMLDNPNNIFQWEGIYLLAGLAGVDEENKIDGILDSFFAKIEGPLMITAANIIKGAAQIVAARPHLGSRIVAEILRAEHGHYETPECYEIVCGTALKAFAKIYKWVPDSQPMLQFAQRHQRSSRAATRAAAEKLLARHERASTREQKAAINV